MSAIETGSDAREEQGANVLCSNCENFDIQSFSRDRHGLRGYSFKDTEEAAGRGCLFCSLLINTFHRMGPSENWNKFRHKNLFLKDYWFHMRLLPAEAGNWWANDSQGQTDEMEPERVGSGSQTNEPAGENVELPAHGNDREGNNAGQGLRAGSLQVVLAAVNYGFPDPTIFQVQPNAAAIFHVVADPDDAAYASGDVRGTYVGKNVHAGEYLTELKQRMNKCFSHMRCCQTLSGQRAFDSHQVTLPTRCIDVEGPGLLIAETGSIISSYIILSHRWTADTGLCSTTADNLASRLQGNLEALESLPKTFRDVFQVARGLGVKYVWIDSLCIIQHGDDGQDWAREAPKMGDYYQLAMLTIYASSSSAETGLFPAVSESRPTSELDFVRMPYRNRKGARQGFFYVYRREDEEQNRKLDKEIVQGSELFSRGWVFQEWLLSRRLLYFTSAGMFYECATAGMSNSLGELWESQKTEKGMFPFVPYYDWVPVNGSFWYRLLEEYSTKSLTYAHPDTVVALAGVAKEFRDLLMRFSSDGRVPVTTVPCGLEYVSGLWAFDLHRGLRWERKAFDGRHERLDAYPSWSWTAAGGPVVWDTNPVGPHAPGSFRRAWETGGRDYEIPKKPTVYPSAKILSVSSPDGVVQQLDGGDARTADRFSSEPPDAFSTMNTSATLRIAGKLAEFVVRERFSKEEDLTVLFNLCGEAIDLGSAQTFWRKVCMPKYPAEIIGWASIDHPEYLQEDSYDGGLGALALLLATSGHIRGYGLGYFGLSTVGLYTVYHVLFVREDLGGRFKRMGVGRVFGKEADRMFREADAREFELS